MVALSARRRSGRRLVGSLRTGKRSSRRRVISSTDNVLVRAAASSMASGRPSSERQRSSTASSPPARGRGAAPRRAAEQLDGVGERKGSEVDQDLAIDVQGHLGGAEDPQVGGGVEELHDEGRGRVEHVLAVVEDHEAGGGLQPFEHRGLAAGDVQAPRSGCRRRRRPSPPSRAGPTTRPLPRLRRRPPAGGRSRPRPRSCRCRPARRSRPTAWWRCDRRPRRSPHSRPTSSGVSDGRFPGIAVVGRTPAGRPRRRGMRRGSRIRCSRSWSCRPGSSPSSSARCRRTRW